MTQGCLDGGPSLRDPLQELQHPLEILAAELDQHEVDAGGHAGGLRVVEFEPTMDLAPRRYADAVVLRPAGRIDHTSSPDFRTALAPYLDRCAAEQDRVVLDLSGVEYISSAGLRVLMLAAKQARAQGGTAVVAALQPIVSEIFEISRFHLVLDVYPSTREALAALSPAALAAFPRPGVT